MIKILIKPDGGEEYELEATTRDLCIWEMAGPNRSIGKLFNDLKMTSIYEVAHVAAKRQQMYTGTLQEFRDSCDLVVKKGIQFDGGDEDGPDPTQTDL